MRRVLLVLALLAIASVAAAQGPPATPCPEGKATAYLDVAGVRAPLYNNGGLFYRFFENEGYVVPKEGNASSIYAASFWVGGIVEGQARAAAANYDTYEFRPGPLAPDGTPVDPTCRAYDHIWRVSRADLAAYDATGAATEDMEAWPWAVGAPVVDGDGDARNYSLAAGDRPAVSGDQTAFWVMNDAAAAYTDSGREPLGLEVRAEAFAQIGDPATPIGAALHYATLYRYRLTYRGEAPLDSAFVGLYVDSDLGYPHDDYQGSDPELGLGFLYNGDDFDGSQSDPWEGEYGAAPPAVGALFLEAPSTLAPQPYPGLARGYMWVSSGDSPPTYPYTPREFHHFMNCRWGDGVPQTYGGRGRGGADPACFLYPSEPGTYWSDVCPDPTCTESYSAGKRRFVLSLGPFTMEPGQEETVAFAIVWARGTDNLNSLERLRSAARVVRAAYLGGRYDPQAPVAQTPEPLPARFALGVAPSPFTASTTIRYEVPEGAGTFRVSVYDARGRRVAVLADGVQAAGSYEATLDGSSLAPGVYVVRLETRTSAASRVVVRVR